jgi:hypothetical protein
MFNVLIDTSVWLGLAEDPKQTPLLTALENMVDDGSLNLLVPQVVITEFEKNRARVAKSSAKSLSSHFNLVKDAIRKTSGDKKEKDKVLTYLSDVDHRIPLMGGTADSTLKRIASLFLAATPIGANDAVKAKAAERALQRKAPCHHDNKNSMADAVLFEIYAECVRTSTVPRSRFAFVTHNKSDFSLANGNQKLPHADLAAAFSKIKSMYFINLAECLRRIDPMRITYTMLEEEWEQEPRSLTEILEAMDRLTAQVWHNRHKNLAWAIEREKHKVVPRKEWEEKWQTVRGYHAKHTVDEIWASALKAAKRVERELGPGNHGPWTDFEWGMLNGKLSALRWALGDEWDMLDT